MRAKSRISTTLVAMLAVMALMSAACTQSDDDDDAGGSTDDTSGSQTTEKSDDDGELSATARGVTADTIKLGYTYLDFDELRELSLTPNGWGDQELAMQSLVDDLNDNGGINGRQIEMVYKPYSALGTESSEAVCLELTQDEEVFAVLGGFLGPAEPANTCITAQQSTILAGGVMSEERLEQAKAPWVAERPMRTRQADILFNLLDEEGKLTDAKVAVVTDVSAEDVRDDVIASLADHDVEPVVDLVSDAAIGEIPAEDNVWATFAERIRDSGADTVLLVGNASAGIRNVASQGLGTDIWALDQETLTALGSTLDLEDARGALSAAGMTEQELWNDETVADCRSAYEEANPDIEITEPEDLQEGDDDVPQGVAVACRFLTLFKLVADEAGPDLTNESFASAAAELGDFSLPGQPYASLTADKHDANDSFRLVSFNPDIGQEGGFDSLTDIQDVTP